jgi:transposase
MFWAGWSGGGAGRRMTRRESSRRRWRGAKVTEVARRNGVAASVVFTWRRQARTAERVGACFAPVQIAAAVETGEENSKPPSEDDRRMRQLPAARNGLIEIDLANRRRIRVDAHVDPEALARVLDVLERR